MLRTVKLKNNTMEQTVKCGEERGGIVPHILDLYIRRKCVVSLTLKPLYLLGTAPPPRLTHSLFGDFGQESGVSALTEEFLISFVWREVVILSADSFWCELYKYEHRKHDHVLFIKYNMKVEE